MMSELTIMHRIANLKPKKQEMVEAFVEFLEQKSQAEPTVNKDCPPLKAGFLKGTFVMKDDFDEPLDDLKEYMSTLVDTIQVVDAEYMSDYRIRFTFNDGTVNEVDFYPFLSKPYQNPMTSQYLDQDRFKQFEITHHRDISWDDYEMCFPLETLYTGKF